MSGCAIFHAWAAANTSCVRAVSATTPCHSGPCSKGYYQRDPCRVREITLWYGEYTAHFFMWRDSKEPSTASRPFQHTPKATASVGYGLLRPAAGHPIPILTNRGGCIVRTTLSACGAGTSIRCFAPPPGASAVFTTRRVDKLFGVPDTTRIWDTSVLEEQAQFTIGEVVVAWVVYHLVPYKDHCPVVETPRFPSPIAWSRCGLVAHMNSRLSSAAISETASFFSSSNLSVGYLNAAA